MVARFSPQVGVGVAEGVAEGVAVMAQWRFCGGGVAVEVLRGVGVAPWGYCAVGVLRGGGVARCGGVLRWAGAHIFCTSFLNAHTYIFNVAECLSFLRKPRGA